MNRTPGHLAEILRDGWKELAAFFVERNWPDTKVGNSAAAINGAVPEIVTALEIAQACTEFAPAPCGHSSQYCFSSDGGKNITCLVCERSRKRIGWAIRHSDEKRWRTMDSIGMPDWTDDPEKALVCRLREHIEAYAADDPEDIRIVEMPW